MLFEYILGLRAPVTPRGCEITLSAFLSLLLVTSCDSLGGIGANLMPNLSIVVHRDSETIN